VKLYYLYKHARAQTVATVAYMAIKFSQCRYRWLASACCVLGQ